MAPAQYSTRLAFCITCYQSTSLPTVHRSRHHILAVRREAATAPVDGVLEVAPLVLEGFEHVEGADVDHLECVVTRVGDQLEPVT